MRPGFIVPTSLESINLDPLNAHVTSAGYGAGKTSVCAAAADLIFNKHCDTVIIWGLAGSLSPAVGVNDILIGTGTAYRDYNIAPLAHSTGVGFVQDYAENIWVDLDPDLAEILYKSMKELFPERKIVKGKICTGDQFVRHASSAEYNRVEKEAYGVDMESAALAHFCHLVGKNIKVGVVRIISDNADHNANINFSRFLDEFGKLNGRMYELRQKLIAENSTLERLTFFRRNISALIAEKTLFDECCHKMYDRYLTCYPSADFESVIAGTGASCHFAEHLAAMFAVPFLDMREKKALSGKKVLMVCDTLSHLSSLSDTWETVSSEGMQIQHILAFTESLTEEEKEILKERKISFSSLVKE